MGIRRGRLGLCQHGQRHAIRAGGEQHPRGFVGGCAGGGHVVDQQDVCPGDGARRAGGECAAYVLQPAGAGQVNLRRRVADADKLAAKRQAQLSRQADGDRAGVVEAAAQTTQPVHGNRHDDVKAFGSAAFVLGGPDTLGQQMREPSSKPQVPAVLQVAHGPPKASSVRAQPVYATKAGQGVMALPAAIGAGRDVRPQRPAAARATRRGHQGEQFEAASFAEPRLKRLVSPACPTHGRQDHVHGTGRA